MLKTIPFVFIICSFSSCAVSAQNVNASLPAKLRTTNTLKTPLGVAGQANGMNTVAIDVKVDTTIRVDPRFAYLSIDFSKITGSNQMDIVNGTNLFWVFDKTGKEIKVPGKVLYRAKAVMEENGPVDMLVKVPFRIKADKNIYTIHYRWESKDKSRNIDILTSK